MYGGIDSRDFVILIFELHMAQLQISYGTHTCLFPAAQVRLCVKIQRPRILEEGVCPRGTAGASQLGLQRNCIGDQPGPHGITVPSMAEQV